MSDLSRRRLIAATLATLTAPAAAHARTPGPAPDPRSEALDQAMTHDQAPPAVAAAVVTSGGQAWADVRGVRRRGQTDAVTLDDRWHLGSNTKAMTAAVWARLVEQGQARWGMPLAEAFPQTPVHEAFAALTVEDLLRHKAGLSDRTDFPLPLVARADTRPVVEQRAALAQALTRPPAGPVGTFAYGNVNYVLAGAVIERIAGRPCEEVVAAELFSPLGIGSAGFGAPRTNVSGGPNAWGHHVQGQAATPIDPELPYADNAPLMAPAGTAHMALADYGRFVQAMLGGGPAGWLSADSLSRLITPLDGDAYALGWSLGPNGAIAHEGSNTLWHAVVIAQPDRGRASIVLSNGGMAGRSATVPLAQRLLLDAADA
ncbi:serine hydrolase domain-containing protein [Brevundimonas sp. VNH65]|uniref:serine hydrolase domain-containing protein n=1 Tax=Brevundimonas sp. VNH65 TaxID=3400917 RepID=UPI003C07F8A6